MFERRLHPQRYCPWLFSLVLICFGIGSLAGTSVPDCGTRGHCQEKKWKNPARCKDPQNEEIIDRDMCPAKCCVYVDRDDRQSNYRVKGDADSMAHCGTQSECSMMQTAGPTRRKEKRDSFTIGVILALVIIPLILVIIALVLGGSSCYQDYRLKQRMQQKVIEYCNMLEAELPASMYSRKVDPESQLDEVEICCICLDDVKGSTVRKLHCKHTFHQACIDRWCLHEIDAQCTRGSRDFSIPDPSLWVCPLCKRLVLQHGEPGITSVSEEEPSNVHMHLFHLCQCMRAYFKKGNDEEDADQLRHVAVQPAWNLSERNHEDDSNPFHPASAQPAAFANASVQAGLTVVSMTDVAEIAPPPSAAIVWV
eukprot:gnl/MRDRNA2_/MRDRNA2_104983_c0_seq1.p1 gnl/MRDRNA2_/MRDRNA2_104983_c0~~gnl/MRDRNA2_/MRDRNA2_104983_c0_seq1.p1  ORF type:complete len:366 (+),score=69.78 gnl/MRDRNA2_/MRDRNA2_104983_c0_seq1:106-1203(+)